VVIRILSENFVKHLADQPGPFESNRVRQVNTEVVPAVVEKLAAR
jgi:hypothetical protein